MTTWLESSRGRTIPLVSNGSRAMVFLLEHSDGDPGEHATDPTGVGSSGGFVLENGQVDEFPDRDTVPVREALRILAHLGTRRSGRGVVRCRYVTTALDEWLSSQAFCTS